MQALLDIKDFTALDVFSRSKRSPIGYEREAVGYVARCEAGRRVDLYVECGEWRMAGKECKEKGYKAKLE